MVRARLHIICGNCGSDDDFEYVHEEYPADAEEATMQYETVLTCKNCSTMHWLNDKAINKNKIRDK